MNTMSIADALQFGSQKLPPDHAKVEVEILLMQSLQMNRTYLYAHLQDPISEKELSKYQAFLNRRVQGCPIAYITGEKPFFTLSLDVNENVLIPRPETELLVDLSVAFLQQQSCAHILDLGTGSGAIAIAIGVLFPTARVDASDISLEALQVATRNCEKYRLQNRLRLIHSDMFANIKDTYNLIVSNPPYIPTSWLDSLPDDVKKEPRLALDGGTDGLQLIDKLIRESRNHLAKNGLLLFEMCDGLSEKCNQKMEYYGFYHCFIKDDLAGIHRICGGYYD